MNHVWMTDKLFWRKVDMSGGPNVCWPWLGYIEKTTGYGSVTRSIEGKTKRLRVHRYAWAQLNGIWLPPDGLQVRYRCDNPPCCNPLTCLLLGTAFDNMQDCVKRGRRRGGKRNGEVHPRSKLTDEQVERMRSDRWTDGAKVAELAEKYGVSKAQVSKITRGVSREIATDPTTVVLTSGAIWDIRTRRERGETLSVIAAVHGVPIAHVSHVVHKRGYR